MTTIFANWAYLRSVICYARDNKNVKLCRPIMALDVHDSHLNQALLNGLYDEFDLYCFCVNPRNSPGVMPVELINRHTESKTEDNDTNLKGQWW